MSQAALPRIRELPSRLSPLRRARRIVVIALLLTLLPVTISYFSTLSRPSNSPFPIRSFEWLRDHGAASIASKIESAYYSFSAPSKGGRALRRLPRQGAGTTSTIHPPNIAPLLGPALPGEGMWAPTETWSGSNSPVQVAQFRSDPNYPQMIAAVAWIDTARTSISFYPGRLEPAVSMTRGPMEVPASARSRLLATFNSAFKLADSRGGLVRAGKTYAPLQPGIATLVRYTDGRMDVRSWSGGSTAPANVTFARQNLPLIVDGGRPNPNLADGRQWGTTVGNAIRVWRSGLGVDANGNLIYAAANQQTVGSLAAILIHAGAVRAMELDINSFWVSFNSYSRPDAGSPTSLLPSMHRSPSRYLTPDDRDFFAVYMR
jgi:hypothetical protein